MYVKNKVVKQTHSVKLMELKPCNIKGRHLAYENFAFVYGQGEKKRSYILVNEKCSGGIIILPNGVGIGDSLRVLGSVYRSEISIVGKVAGLKSCKISFMIVENKSKGDEVSEEIK